jgi:hypothetical protein
VKLFRKNLLNRSIHILLSILILQQGFTYTLLNKSADFIEDESFETCLVEVLEWICRNDIDRQSGTELPEPQQSSEEERIETELLEDKELMPRTVSWTSGMLLYAFMHNTDWLSTKHSSLNKPPPELS